MKRSLLPSTQMNSHYATRPALRQKRNEHEFSLSRINPPGSPVQTSTLDNHGCRRAAGTHAGKGPERQHPTMKLRLTTAFLTALTLAAQPPATSKLDYVVYLSRHGVRSLLSTNKTLGNLSVDPWPEWDVPVGSLTAHGRWLMQLMGGYDREYFTQAGLFSGAASSQNCADADRLYLWADNAQRDIETARALAVGMFPDCRVPIHSVGGALKDPIFSPDTSPRAPGIKALDHTIAAAALGGRIGDNPRLLTAPFAAEVDLMQRILLACPPTGSCRSSPDGRKPKRLILDEIPQPDPPAKPRDHLAELTSISGQIDPIAEAFYLEYVDGWDMKDIGWGRVDETAMLRLMNMRANFISQVQRTPFTAKAHSSNLLSHILRSMEQSTGTQSVPGSLGSPGDKALMILGHDGDIVPLAAGLNLSWIAEGYGAGDTPPGSALVFEIWRDTTTGKRAVHTWMLTETPQKMRAAVPLSLKDPPTRTPVYVPGCSVAAEGYPCDWDAFRKLADSAIDHDYVANTR